MLNQNVNNSNLKQNWICQQNELFQMLTFTINSLNALYYYNVMISYLIIETKNVL